MGRRKYVGKYPKQWRGDGSPQERGPDRPLSDSAARVIARWEIVEYPDNSYPQLFGYRKFGGFGK